MKLLLVEDDPADARLIREMLKDSRGGRFECQQVRRLDSAVEALRQEAFDIVLLDLGLPDSQGMKTLSVAQQTAGAVPIVVLTGRDDESFALETVRSGAQDYLVKGRFDAELLMRIMRYAIERKSAQEQVRRLNAELEHRVAERTTQLQAVNDELLKEIAERRRADQALQEAQARLQAHAEDLEKIVAARTATLQETINELEHFSYAIIHDLRAPLRAMQGFAQMLEEESASCGHTLNTDYFRRIKVASNRMDRLITDSVSYSKAVRLKLAPEPVNLFQLVKGLVETYPNLQPDKADIEIDPQLPTVVGNPAALTQCFSNLLDNAVKFVNSGRKPQVRVGAESPQIRGGTRFVRIWVEDKGVGIPKAAQHRIFNMFQRANTEHEGTGIGLAIVRKVVERMGGSVGFESEEGRGSRFWVELRLA